MKKKNYGICIIICVFVSGCYNSRLGFISSRIEKFDQRKINYDSIVLMDSSLNKSITSNLIGEYNYPVLSGYTGVYLKIDSNNTFSEISHSDVHTPAIFDKTSRGKWIIRDSFLNLYPNGLRSKKFEFEIIKLDSLIFLVPLKRKSKFIILINQNKNVIYELNNKYNQLSYNSNLSYHLYFLSETCFIKNKPFPKFKKK